MRSLCLVLFAVVASGTTAVAGPIYLALGDSSAFGETNRTQNPSNGDRGYVRPFADYLGTVYGTRPTVANFAINGETSSSFFSGQYATLANPLGRISPDGQSLNTNYIGLIDPTAQFVRMRAAFNAANSGNVRAVTLHLGANDLDAASTDPAFAADPFGVIQATLNRFAGNYSGLLADVTGRFPNASVYALGYHNPYNGEPPSPFNALADLAIRALNQYIAGLAAGYGATYVDVYGAINPNEANLTLIGTRPFDPVNYVHLNDAGYAAAGNQLIRAAGGQPVPEPASLLLVGMGGLVLLARRKRRGKAVA